MRWRAKEGAGATFDRAFLILCAQVLVLSAGQGLIVPILPLYAASFGVGATMIGLLLAAQAFPRVFANIPAGRLADRYGAHRLLATAAGVGAIAALAAGLAPSYWWLFASRILQGVGGAISHTSGLTYTATVSPSASRGRHIALYQGNFLIGVGIGPVVGGVMAERLGYRSPFIAFSVIAAITGVWVLRGLPDPRSVLARTHPTSQTADPVGRAAPPLAAVPGHRRGDLLRHPAVLWACIFAFVAAYTRTSTRDFGIVLVSTELGAGEGTIGAIMTLMVLANLAVLSIAGTLTDRYGARRVITLSWIFTAVGMGMFAMSDLVLSLFVAALVYGLASGVGNPVPAIYIANSVPSERVGAAMGIYRAVNDAGMIVGPLAMGLLVTTLDVRSGLWVNVGFVSVATVALLLTQQDRGTGAPPGHHSRGTRRRGRDSDR